MKRLSLAGAVVGMVVVLWAATALAAPGDLDSTFGTNGKVITAFSSFQVYGERVALQADGNIVVVGTAVSNGLANNRFAVARYNPDGSLDTTFSGDGKVLVGRFGPAGGADAYDVAIQPDGKIVVVGAAGTESGAYNSGAFFAIARLNPDGSLDKTFGGDGKAVTKFEPASCGCVHALSVALQSDGKIVVAGFAGSDLALARYNPDGSLDSTFSSDGRRMTRLGGPDAVGAAVAVQPNGRIVVAGSLDDSLLIARFGPRGGLDKTFGGGDGKTAFVHGSFGRDVALQPDGKIVAVGYRSTISADKFMVVRVDSQGNPDLTFGGGNGVVITPFGDGLADGVAIQSDGKIVALGTSFANNFYIAVARYNPDGTLDTTFGGGDGKVTTSMGSGTNGSDVALQSDGKIVGIGSVGYLAKFAVVRYLAA